MAIKEPFEPWVVAMCVTDGQFAVPAVHITKRAWSAHRAQRAKKTLIAGASIPHNY